VTGVDNSAELIRIARSELRAADFCVQDARELHLNECCDAVLCTFDSLNHIPDIAGLRMVFERVRQALKPGGLFVFDMNLEEAYSADLRQWAVNITDRTVGLVRGTFDAAAKTARTELIWFVRANGDDANRNDLWKQHRSTIEQQCFPQSEILESLASAGFRHIECVPSRDAGVTSDLGFGRVFFVTNAPVHE
ncbi:MAG: class I SAM-dependent methyltransferase, partial [Acidobacteriaceae bacterium]|nr:class I SAM-dependent methyltransferase [Acidobacteriaceae bacterium]